MNIHRILEQNLCQLLDGQVAGKGVLRPHQVPPLSLPGGSQVVDQLHLVRVLCMVVGASDDGKHSHYLLCCILQLGEPCAHHSHLLLPHFPES